jgi:hypothetical protein
MKMFKHIFFFERISRSIYCQKNKLYKQSETTPSKTPYNQRVSLGKQPNKTIKETTEQLTTLMQYSDINIPPMAEGDILHTP